MRTVFNLKWMVLYFYFQSLKSALPELEEERGTFAIPGGTVVVKTALSSLSLCATSRMNVGNQTIETCDIIFAVILVRL